MNIFSGATAFGLLALVVTLSSAGAEQRRFVYMVQPDGSTTGGPGEGRGVLVLDIDRKFSFVKRITTPGMLKVRQGVSTGCGMRGIAVDAKAGRLYYTWHQGKNPGDDGGGCIDLKTDQVIWERSYHFSCERWQLSPDGKTLYTPCHWTDTKSRAIHTIDAATGEPGRVYHTGEVWPNHPLIMHPDGTRFFVGNGCFDIATGKQLWVAPKGYGGTCHKVLDTGGTRLYTGRHPEGDTVATWILDALTGKYHCVMTAENGKFTRGAKYVEVDWLDGDIIWAGQDECHGFIYRNYPTVRAMK